MGCGDATNEDADVLPPFPVVNGRILSGVSVNGITDTHKLTCDSFRKKLIEHVDILYKQNNIKWPRSRKK